MSIHHSRYQAGSPSLYALDLAGLDREFSKKNTKEGSWDPETKYVQKSGREHGLISETFAKQEFKHLKVLREHALAPDALPEPKFITKQPTQYPGTCADLVEKIKPSVDALINTMDYNPLNTYVQVIDQVEQGKKFQECRISSDEEIEGSCCFGMSKFIVEKARNPAHHIEGIVVDQHVDHQIFAHAAVAFLCSDGWVLIESSLPADKRYFKVLFDKPYIDEKDGFKITAIGNDRNARLIIEANANYAAPVSRVEYWIKIANSDQGVMKRFMTHQGFTPITAYQPGQKLSNKVIYIYIDEERIEFEDRTHPHVAPRDPLKQTAKEYRERPKYLFNKTEMSFDDVLKNDFLGKLEAFAGNDYKTPVPVLYAQIYKIASKKGTIAQAFRDIHRSLPGNAKPPVTTLSTYVYPGAQAFVEQVTTKV